MNYECINGWTKDKMLEVVRARPFEERAEIVILDVLNEYLCVYLANNGNKCAVGLFIPDGHPAQKETNTIAIISVDFPNLRELMPLEICDMQVLQNVHDRCIDNKAKTAMINWIEQNVKE